MAFAADWKRSYENQSYKPYQSRGGYTSNRGGFTQSKGGVKRNSTLYCDHCNYTGHTIDRCYKLHGYPKDFKSICQKKFAHCAQTEEQEQPCTDLTTDDVVHASFTKEQYSQLLALLDKQKSEDSHKQILTENTSHSAFFAGKFCLYSHHARSWIFDSGATDHFCYDLHMFSTYKLIENKENFITIPNGNRVQVTHIGTVKLNAAIELQDVLYVPDFLFNLISVHKLCRDMKCEVTFNNHNCFL